jgi:hypothetical protein
MRKIAAIGLVAAALMAGASINQGAEAMSPQKPKTAVCDPKPVHRLDRYTTWQYVTPDLAKYEHIGRCSKVIVGTGQSVIINQRGNVVDVS